MRAVIRDFLRAWAEAGHRYEYLDRDVEFAVLNFTDEGHFIIQQTLYAGNRRGLVDEVREGHFNVSGFGFETLDHFAQDGFERFNRDFTFVHVEYLDEARHVRTLEIVRQVHVHVEHGNGMLHAAGFVLDFDRVADGFDADLVDGKMSGVGGVLHVLDGGGNRLVHELLVSVGVLK